MKKIGQIMSIGILATVLLAGCSDSSSDKKPVKEQGVALETGKDGKENIKKEGKEVTQAYKLSTKEQFIEKWNKEADRW